MSILALPMYEGKDLWMDLLYCKDLNHRDDFVARYLKIKNKEYQTGYKEFTETINTFDQVINGELSRINAY